MVGMNKQHLQSRAGSSNGDGKIRPESNVATAHNAKLEYLSRVGLSFGCSSSDGSLVEGSWRLQIWCRSSSATHLESSRYRVGLLNSKGGAGCCQETKQEGF